MPSIDIKGPNSFRVRIRPLDLPPLQLTFYTLKEAEEWIDQHADAYYENPDPYLQWAKDNRLSIKTKGIYHVHIPLENYTK